MKCNLPVLWQEEEWLTENPERISPSQININECLRSAKNLYQGKKLLHIGIGNSSMFKELKDVFGQIDGITNTRQEEEEGHKLSQDGSYQIFNFNKYDILLLNQLDNDYDVIADNSLKSFACCNEHWHGFLTTILKKLKLGGRLISHTAGFGGYISPVWANVMDNSLTMEELYQLIPPGYHLFELKHLKDKNGDYLFIIERSK